MKFNAKGVIPLDNENHTPGGPEAAETEPDLIEGIDEDGNKVQLEVLRYFFYNGDEYVALGEAHPECEDGEPCGHDHGDEDEEETVNLYIMKVVEFEEDGEEMEEFVPVEDDDLLEKLLELLETEEESDLTEDEN